MKINDLIFSIILLFDTIFSPFVIVGSFPLKKRVAFSLLFYTVFWVSWIVFLYIYRNKNFDDNFLVRSINNNQYKNENLGFSVQS